MALSREISKDVREDRIFEASLHGIDLREKENFEQTPENRDRIKRALDMMNKRIKEKQGAMGGTSADTN